MPQSLKTPLPVDTPKKAGLTELQLSADVLHEDTLHALGENAAALLHELRSPLQAVRAHIQLLERKIGAREDEELSRHFPPLYRSVEHINNLLDQFLRLSRFSETCLASLDMRACVNELLPLLRSMAVMRGVDMADDLPEGLPPCQGDDQQIKRLLFNLFANALDACAEEKQARIAVRLKQQGQELALSVEDNGCGIASDKLEAIWQPFFTCKATGTGLGLPCCLKIASEHHGSLTVISKLDQGSCFTLSLPLVTP